MKKSLFIFIGILSLILSAYNVSKAEEPILNVTVPDVTVQKSSFDTVATKAVTQTKAAEKKVVSSTKSAADKTVKTTKDVAEKTAQGTKNGVDKSVQSSKNFADKTVVATKSAAKKTAETTKSITDKAVDNTKDFIDDFPPGKEITLEGLQKEASIKTLKNERNELKSAYNSRIKDIKAKIKATEQSTLINDVQRHDRIYNLNKQKLELEQERDTAVAKYNAKIAEIKKAK